MTPRWLAVISLALLIGCIGSPGGGDDDRDKDRSKAEERARKYCLDDAKSRGLRVEDVGKIEKLGKKQYELRLRVETKKKDGKKNGEFRVVCRYDDKARSATID